MFLSSGDKSVTSVSLKNTLPSVGLSKPEIKFKRVVFPHPEGPSSAPAHPSSKTKSIPLSASAPFLLLPP